MLAGCGGGGNIAGMSLDINQPPQVLPALAVGQPQSIYIICVLDTWCKVSWRDPEYPFANNVAIIYRNTVDDFDTATEIGREDFSALYLDRTVVAGTRYYYWVVLEDESGERGPVSDSAFNSQCVRSLTVSSCAPPSEPDTKTVDLEPEPEVQRLPFLREASDAHYQAVKQPLLATEAQQAPVYQDGTHLFVGIDQGTDTLADMKFAGQSQVSSTETVVTPTGSYRTSITRTTKTTTSKRGDLDVRHACVNERQGRGGAAELLAAYLAQSARVQRAEDGMPLVLRFTAPPVVHFGGTATAADVDRLVRAVQLVNAALPLEWRMQMPSGVPSPAPESETQEGIYVEFIPEANYAGPSSDSLGHTETFWLQDASIPYATVRMNKAYRKHGERGAVGVLAHELIHALGIGHVSGNFPSIMAPELDVSAQDTPLSLLYPIDREALRALYGRMENGDVPTDFGAWANTSTYLLGNGDHAAFGVAWRNGYGEPWAYGYLPETDLADNTALTGTATWAGALLGFTPEAAPVAGDAEVGVNLNDLTGQADFTSLESWAAGDAPGRWRWGDGDLRYSVAIVGNTFRQTGGDDGILTGAFFGESHEGMGGTLEREDLTAAFGGKR